MYNVYRFQNLIKVFDKDQHTILKRTKTKNKKNV